jgi:hypothetical protein
MRMIYQGVVIPQLLWGVSAWYSPGSHIVPARQLNQIVAKLIRIQRRAAILISGAFKSTAGMALDIELFMVLIRLQMQQIIEETAIRLRTGPVWAHPPSLRGRRPLKETRLGGLTPLEALSRGARSLLALGRDQRWETRKAFVIAPWEPLIQATISVAEAAEGALQAPGPPRRGEERYYTDGSGYLSHVGGAMVNPARKVERRQYLGTEGDSSVYAGQGQLVRKVTVLSDSQAAIQAVARPGRPSGQYILQDIYIRAKALQETGAELRVQWVPAHVGIAGNEEADRVAKLAASQRGQNRGVGVAPPTLIRLASAAKRCVRARIAARWKKLWESTGVVKPTKWLIKAPGKKALALYTGLPKAYTSIIMQLRTGRSALNHFLFKIKRHEDGQSSCREGPQTPRHVVLECARWGGLRRQMFTKIAARTELSPVQAHD